MAGYLFEVETKDAMELTKHLEKGLHHLGLAMNIADDICNAGGEMGMRRGYRNGSGGGSYTTRGYREYDDMDEYDDMGYPMGMRRGYRRGR